MEDRIFLDIDDVLKEGERATLFSFKNCKKTAWVSRKYYEPFPGSICVPQWYFKKYIAPQLKDSE